jgi:dGTPase
MPQKPQKLKPHNLKPGERWSAPYAVDASTSRGRLFPEPPSPTRSGFQRDRDRIVHSTAFRRLKHKTQVFVEHEGDHYRTRLTHTLEVAQIARSIARALGLDEDLAETLALAHDLGHTPFGHAGERALERVLQQHGGFDHNAQSLKIVTSLEKRYASFDGLNLTWETLEGLVKHNGPLTDISGRPVGPHLGKPLPEAIATYDSLHSLELWSQASIEAQCAAIADDIAYNAHDLDDGLRSGIISLDDLKGVPFLAEQLHDIKTAYPSLDRARTTHELQRKVITLLVEDVIAETASNIEHLDIRSALAARAEKSPVVRFSSAMALNEKSIRTFLFARLYRHPKVMSVMTEAESVVEALYQAFYSTPEHLPEEWQTGWLDLSEAGKCMRIADFIAGMTDRYALETHKRLFSQKPLFDQKRSFDGLGNLR